MYIYIYICIHMYYFDFLFFEAAFQAGKPYVRMKSGKKGKVPMEVLFFIIIRGMLLIIFVIIIIIISSSSRLSLYIYIKRERERERGVLRGHDPVRSEQHEQARRAASRRQPLLGKADRHDILQYDII